MKLKKILFVFIIASIAIFTLSLSVNAYNANDLVSYVTGPHMINGIEYKLSNSDATSAKDYILNKNITDEQAQQIHDYLEQAKAKAGSASNLSQLSDKTKAEIVDLLKQAGNVLGVVVNVNTVNKTVTIAEKNGTVISSGSYATDGNGGLTLRYTSAGTNSGSGSTSSASTSSTVTGNRTGTFVYTGANNTVYVVALLAVVAVSTFLMKKVYAK